MSRRKRMKSWMKSWPNGVLRKLTYPKISLFSLLDATAEKLPNKTATIFYGSTLTYSKLKVLTDKFATALYNIDLKRGDRVAVLLPNCPQFIVGYFGILKAGGTVVLLNPMWDKSEIEHQLNQSEAKFLLCLDLIYERLHDVNFETGKTIITNLMDLSPFHHRLFARAKGIKPKSFPGTLSLHRLLKSYEPNPPEVRVDPKEDIAVLLYSSGIIGIPKGIMLTHFNLLANAMQCAHFVYLSADDRVLAVLPFFHSFGMTTCMNTPMYRGSSIILLPRFNTLEVLKTIERNRPTFFVGVPAMFEAIINFPNVRRYDLGSIKYCISGAAPLSDEVGNKMRELTKALVVQGYGLSEASPVTHINPLDDAKKIKRDSIGIPISDTDAWITDIDTGTKELQPGEIGEIVVKGPQVMKGYWRMWEEVVLKNGALYTGDVGYLDKDGYFYVLERKKDIVHVRDWNVLPSDIEKVLKKYPAIKSVAVVGVADPSYGEVPKAFVVLKDEYKTKVCEKDILNFCKDNLPPYQVPKYLEFKEDLPSTITGKILKKALK